MMLGRGPMKWIVQPLWFASMALVCYLSLTPRMELPYRFIGADKVWHCLGYMWLAILPFFGFEKMQRAFAGAGAMAFLGIGLEFAQQHVPGRQFSVADMIANCVGVSLGIIAARRLKIRYGSLSSARDHREIDS